jgi:hypothetical protein
MLYLTSNRKENKAILREKISPLIRSHHRGYVFARENLNVPESVRIEAIKAVKALELDFGAADIKIQ